MPREGPLARLLGRLVWLGESRPYGPRSHTAGWRCGPHAAGAQRHSPVRIVRPLPVLVRGVHTPGSPRATVGPFRSRAARRCSAPPLWWHVQCGMKTRDRACRCALGGDGHGRSPLAADPWSPV